MGFLDNSAAVFPAKSVPLFLVKSAGPFLARAVATRQSRSAETSRGNSVGRCPSRVVAQSPSRVADLSPSRAVARCRSRSADRYRDSLVRTFARTSSGAKCATTAKTKTLPDQKDQEDADIAVQIKNYNCHNYSKISFHLKILHPTCRLA